MDGTFYSKMDEAKKHSPTVKSALNTLLCAPFKIGKGLLLDAITLGGACNDGYFKNGKKTYTKKAIDKLKRT